MSMGRFILVFAAFLGLVRMAQVDAGEVRVVTGDEAARLFVYNNKAIHPFCVDFPADSARWNPVALSGCSATAVVAATGPDGWSKADYPREDGPRLSVAHASYLVLAAKGDLFLLATASSGGGTGRFSHLRWVRLAAGQLSLMQNEMTGDRCLGGLSGYAVKAGRIEFSRNLPAAEIIRLSGVAVERSVLGELNGTPPDCDGVARYAYDPAAQTMLLQSLELRMPAAPEAHAKDPQACLDRLILRPGSNRLLRPEDLQRLGREFVASCVSPPRQ